MIDLIRCEVCKKPFPEKLIFPFTSANGRSTQVCTLCEPNFLAAFHRTNLSPACFINRDHFNSYHELLEGEFFERSLDIRYILAAYINSIPSIFQEARPFIKPFPFAWKYNCHFTLFTDQRSPTFINKDPSESRITIIYHEERGYHSHIYFRQNTDVQILINFAEKIFNSDDQLYKKHIQFFTNEHLKKLDSMSQRMANQILCILRLHSNK